MGLAINMTQNVTLHPELYLIQAQVVLDYTFKCIQHKLNSSQA